MAQPRWDLTRVRYAERPTVMLFTSLVFLRTVSQDPSGLSALLIDLLIPSQVVRDVNTKIFLGRDYRAGHMIDKANGFKFPCDALRFAFAVVKF